MEHLFGPLGSTQLFLLICALGLALTFEFVNGFHDTANAVATVIYTKSLPPWIAVILSGLFNLTGVLMSGGAVAFTIISLLPVDLVMNVGSGSGFAMVFSLLISAIVWNLGTWYLGLPASSSHTLIGSIIGVGLMHSFITTGDLMAGVNWGEAKKAGSALLISPIVGFGCTALLFILVKILVKRPDLYREPDPNKPPPWWIRITLWITCSGVSYNHGSNDGQKGMGLIMLILVAVVPGNFALNLAVPDKAISALVEKSAVAAKIIQPTPAATMMKPEEATHALALYLRPNSALTDDVLPALAEKNSEVAVKLAPLKSLSELPAKERNGLRSAMFFTSETISKLNKAHRFSKPDADKLADYQKGLEGVTRFIPIWVKCAVAIALGFGTMIGWKRIVVTVGEKIGKTHLTYAQGASAELVTMVIIGNAGKLGLPVSTTHVLSSGIAGSMAANKSGLQMGTVRNILLAWVLTLPMCVFLGATFFAAGLSLVSKLLGLH